MFLKVLLLYSHLDLFPKKLGEVSKHKEISASKKMYQGIQEKILSEPVYTITLAIDLVCHKGMVNKGTSNLLEDSGSFSCMDQTERRNRSYRS